MHPKENFDTNKVNSVLEKIHNNLDDDDDKDAFNPPPRAESSGVQKTIPKKEQESMVNMTSNNDLMFRTLGRAPQPTYQNKDNLDLNDYSNYGDSKTVEDYYKKVIPGFNASNQNFQNNPTNKLYHKMSYDVPMNNAEPNQEILLKKLNYMISLLEDQQDERTNNVTEEVVLYSFLGIYKMKKLLIS
jgi:hypothetical protein